MPCFYLATIFIVLPLVGSRGYISIDIVKEMTLFYIKLSTINSLSLLIDPPIMKGVI